MNQIYKQKINKCLFMMLLVLALSAVIIPNVHAALSDFEPVQKVFGYVLDFFGFEWLQNMGESAEIGFVRLLIFILVARLIYAGASLTPIDRTTAIVVSIVIALLGTIGIPSVLILTIVSLYSTVVSMFLIGIVIYGVIWLYRAIPSVSIWHSIARIIVLCFALALFGALSYIIIG